MPAVEYAHFGTRPTAHKKHHIQKKRKSRQEICAPLKWFCFLTNFLTFLFGVTLLTLGIYLCIKDPRSVSAWADIFLNPAVMLTVIGLSVCLVSLIGTMGALRDNIGLLKVFAFCVFITYVLIVAFTFILFYLFYAETGDGLSAKNILMYSIENYHTNRNLADFVDYIQEQLECCGVSSTSQGYKDWQYSQQFTCNISNPNPERCGVPFSCCRKSVVSEAGGPNNPLLLSIKSLECWQNAQNKRPQDVEVDLYVRGCLQPLRNLFESHAAYIGALVAFIIIPVCISICTSNILAKQIDNQHYLLQREAQRCERYQRRERERMTEHFLRKLEEAKLKSRQSASREPGSKSDVEIPPKEMKESRARKRTESPVLIAVTSPLNTAKDRTADEKHHKNHKKTSRSMETKK